ncbi:MAG: GNAT family N-acetyltransferase [Planctomycetota bacterium]|jgi:GNAT superfamily N-acetyltransferase
MIIYEKTPVTDAEIGELRSAVKWDHDTGTYDRVLKGVHTYFVARDKEKLIGFVSVISDGAADAFLVDLMVHPDYQKQGLGKELVQRAIKYSKSIGVQCIHVTFNPTEEQFYRKCGFHVLGGGIIDFKTMNVEL